MQKNAFPGLTQANREAAVELLAGIRHVRDDLGGVVIGTGTLRGWVRFGSGATRSAIAGVDPTGLHTVRRLFLHNDRDWRVAVLVKMSGTDDPLELTIDISMEDWARAEHATDMFIAELHDALN